MRRPNKRKNQTKKETELRSREDRSEDLERRRKLRQTFGVWVLFKRMYALSAELRSELDLKRTAPPLIFAARSAVSAIAQPLVRSIM